MLADVVARPLSIVFQQSWESEEDPGAWKLANTCICHSTLCLASSSYTTNKTVPLTSELPGLFFLNTKPES